jgi:hypothetical protein
MMTYAPWQRYNEEKARREREQARPRPALQLPLAQPTQITGSIQAPEAEPRGVCDIDDEFRVDLTI